MEARNRKLIFPLSASKVHFTGNLSFTRKFPLAKNHIFLFFVNFMAIRETAEFSSNAE